MSMNDDTKKTFLNALGQLGANAAIMMPDGITLPKDEQLTGAATALPYVEAINHHNMEMSKSVLMQFVDIGTGDSGGGGFSLSKNHLDFAMMGLEHLMGEVTDMWNQQVFPELIWWNFKSKNVPILEFPTLESDTREAMLEIFSKILTARETPVSPEFIAEMEKKVALEFGFELDDEEVMENQKRRIAQEELEQAMEQANRDIGAAVSKMETADILKDSGLMNYMSGWWESTSRKISDRIVSEVG
jgi:phage gp29-like protein